MVVKGVKRETKALDSYAESRTEIVMTRFGIDNFEHIQQFSVFVSNSDFVPNYLPFGHVFR